MNDVVVLQQADLIEVLRLIAEDLDFESLEQAHFSVRTHDLWLILLQMQYLPYFRVALWQVKKLVEGALCDVPELTHSTRSFSVNGKKENRLVFRAGQAIPGGKPKHFICEPVSWAGKQREAAGRGRSESC